MFKIDSRTGEITTTKPLDREATPRYDVTVYARDGSSPAQYDAATVVVHVIDENDHSPELR